MKSIFIKDVELLEEIQRKTTNLTLGTMEQEQ